MESSGNPVIQNVWSENWKKSGSFRFPRKMIGIWHKSKSFPRLRGRHLGEAWETLTSPLVERQVCYRKTYKWDSMGIERRSIWARREGKREGDGNRRNVHAVKVYCWFIVDDSLCCDCAYYNTLYIIHLYCTCVWVRYIDILVGHRLNAFWEASRE